MNNLPDSLTGKEDQLEALEDQLRTGLAAHGNFSRARESLKRLPVLLFGNDAKLAVDHVEAELRKSQKKIIDLTYPDGVTPPGHADWYLSPWAGERIWPSFRQYLERKSWYDKDIEVVDGASSKILNSMKFPKLPDFDTRGLVVGYVQSGKTANFTALIAKSVDAGYRVVIILAGMTESLRTQTHDRLHAELVKANPELWGDMTEDGDFYGANIPAYMMANIAPGGALFFVVKKNTHVLGHINDWFSKVDRAQLRNTPVLVIDDEADSASVNTKKKASEVSAINGRIRDLLGTFPKVAYVGYTATPFANVFISPECKDLYPRDFIWSLPRPKRYFGPERIFGKTLLSTEEEVLDDGLDIVRDVPEVEVPDTGQKNEVAMLQPPSRAGRFDWQPQIPSSLKQALRYFLLATACRYARGQEDEHSSMLVHTTLYTDCHRKLEELVNRELAYFKRSWTRGSKKQLTELKSLWNDECSRLEGDRSELGVAKTPFSSIKDFIPLVLDRCHVVVDNSSSEESDLPLSYSREPDANTGLFWDGTKASSRDELSDPRVFIAIGGNTLSRGLTLEGLVVSFFIRSASAYDTLLQMGRWFGFRVGYEDLPRVWMTPTLRNQFQHLAAVEEEIRNDIRLYERWEKTPLDFGVRVRTHPRLAITSRLKMQNFAVAQRGYGGSRPQTFLFRHEDESWLENNRKAGESLVTAVGSDRFRPLHDLQGHFIARDVPVEMIKEFLGTYKFAEALDDQLNSDADDGREMVKYIEYEKTNPKKQDSHLENWNILILGRNPENKARGNQGQELGEMVLGLEAPIPCIERSRFRETNPANIKALMGPEDDVLDLLTRREAEGLGWVLRLERRRKLLPHHGLLVLYPISKDSLPQKKKKADYRHPLNAATHVLGCAVVFPPGLRALPGDYLNNLYLPAPEDLRTIEDAEISVEEVKESIEAEAEKIYGEAKQ